MAKKEEKIILENIELKPQVIGYTYQKKNNIGRVIFIFIVFALAVFYINDISVFINNLLGKKSSEAISNLTGNNKEDKDDNQDNIENEVNYNIYSNGLEFIEGKMTLNNFNFSNNKLTFDILNKTETTLELTNKKYFLETYTQDKTLLERLKVDVGSIKSGEKVSYELVIKNPFYYVVLEEKNISDYPIIKLEENENGIASMTCTKDIENIIYMFNKEELINLKHTISDSNITSDNYYNNYNLYQNKVSSYNLMDGITGTFNGTLNGYTAILTLDLQRASLSNLQERFYFNYKEQPKVVKFEMQTYGFNCS